jgi:hypothetical protein
MLMKTFFSSAAEIEIKYMLLFESLKDCIEHVVLFFQSRKLCSPLSMFLYEMRNAAHMESHSRENVPQCCL